MRKRALILLGGLLLGVLPGTAWASKAGPVFDKYGAHFHSAFEPTRNAARFIPQTDTLRLLSQLVSALIIVGGLLTKMRKDETQMEGIASMVLKVGFIASLPIFGDYFEETCGYMANATGHATFPYVENGSAYSTTLVPVSSSQVPKVVRKIFELTNQWTINSSPANDQLEETSDPTADQDDTWFAREGHWAAGTVRLISDPAVARWAAVAGAFRVAIIHLIVLGVGLICTLIVVVTYFAEILRLFLFHAGLAILPVFIAGLGVECMKNQSVRYILGLVSVGLWPVGWAIANIGTVRLINVANNFISNLLKTNPGKGADQRCHSHDRGRDAVYGLGRHGPVDRADPRLVPLDAGRVDLWAGFDQPHFDPRRTDDRGNRGRDRGDHDFDDNYDRWRGSADRQLDDGRGGKDFGADEPRRGGGRFG
jgi:hypothetical protein